jgi:phosphatidylserine/phosphatidylglycerophosphate/cardiolipin synthase-like enzyme
MTMSARRNVAEPAAETRSARGRPSAAGLLAPGRNAWRSETSARTAVMVDGFDYFRHLQQALRSARRSIMIIGWDFDDAIRLTDDGPALGDLLRGLVEAHPDLEVRVLIWSVAVLHAPSPVMPLLFGSPWQQHPRISVKLDTAHPFYAAHHQKIVVIDDALAFVGGIDMTNGRRDTPEHRPDEPRRAGPDGKPAEPVHDVHMAVSGPAAAALGVIARDRWLVATGESLPRISGADLDALWPPDLPATFSDLPVAIARTWPRWRTRPPAYESQAMIRDMLMAAERHLYIEAQYLSARYVRTALRRLLRRQSGPEIVVVLNRMPDVFVERLVMGENCMRMVRALKKADRHGRLAIFYPVVAGEDGDHAVHVHSKLIITDDQVIRIGSANLNNRSVGLDTECDLALEASDDADRERIAAIRDGLLAEHLGAEPADVAAAVAETGSLIRTIERFNHRPRGLRPFPVTPGPAHFVWGTRFLDPEAPFEPGWLLRLGAYRRRAPGLLPAR